MPEAFADGEQADRAAEAPVPGTLPARQGLPRGLDLAIGRPVTVSTETAAGPPTNAVDGDPATHWSPGPGTAATLTVDLGGEEALYGTGITWAGRLPDHYAIQRSVDGREWQPFRGAPGNGTPLTVLDAVGDGPVHARFVRLVCSDDAALPPVAALRVYGHRAGAAALIRGADLSTLSALEAAGRTFADAEGARPAEQILAAHGWNLARLRLWVDPPNAFNGLADVAAMARRVKAAGLQLLLCLHYSDFWADPAKQITPAAWQGQDLAALTATVHDYTRSVVAALARQGTPADIVQIGNEVTPGMLWPQGQVYLDGVERWSAFATLLKAGIAGARAGAQGGRAPEIMVHIDRGGDPAGAQRFYDHIRAEGVAFDLIGLSYYPFWHGSLSDLRTNLDNLALRYGLPIVVVETAYPWTRDDHDGFPNIVGPSTTLPAEYPATPAGQGLFVRDLLSLVARTPGDLGRGIVYWEPAWIPGVGWEPGAGNNWDNQTVFDPQGRALDSIDAMRI